MPVWSDFDNILTVPFISQLVLDYAKTVLGKLSYFYRKRLKDRNKESQCHHGNMRLEICCLKDENVLSTSLVMLISMGDDYHLP